MVLGGRGGASDCQGGASVSDLREQAIEAIAKVLHDHGPGPAGKPPTKDWRDCYNADAHGGTAPRVLDAALDSLNENAKEWEMSGYRHENLYLRSYVESLILALRDEEEEVS